jgi:virulence-associated protein VagC
MTAADIIARLRNDGLGIRASGGRIVLTPKKQATPELRALVQAHKADLLEALARWPDGRVPVRDFRTEPPRRDELALPDLAERRPQVIKGRRTWRR